MAVTDGTLSGTYVQRIAYNTALLSAGQQWFQTDTASVGGTTFASGYYSWTGTTWSYVVGGGNTLMSPINVIGRFVDMINTLRAAIFAKMVASSATGDTGTAAGIFARGETEITNAQNQTVISGVIGYANHYGSGTVTQANGVNGVVQNVTTGTITSAFGGQFGVTTQQTGVIGSGYTIYAVAPTTTVNGTITNAFGLVIENHGLTGMTASYGIYMYPQSGAGASYNFYINGTATSIMGHGSYVFGDGITALATNATYGFVYIPTCAGTPTGVPTTRTGTAPMVFDTTGNKLWIYTSGAWKGVVVA